MSNIGVRLQNQEAVEQWLTLARLAAARSESGVFSAQDVEDLFLALGLPNATRRDNAMRSLVRNCWVRDAGARGRWKLTPVGRARAAETFSEVDLAALSAEAIAEGGAVLGHIRHTVIHPWLAPPGLIPGLRKFLDQHPFERNVFAMTRFPHEDDVDPVKSAVMAARLACEKHGLDLHLASDRAIDDDLWSNVAAHMWASHYGIAFFEDRVDRGLNHNMTIEVGGMMMTGRRCALLKDDSVSKMPTDLIGKIYKELDLSDVAAVEAAVHTWIREDLGLGPCSKCGN